MKVALSMILFALLATCGPSFSCDDNAPTYLLDEDFKAHIVFPVGSYWVYADQNGNKDSVVLYRQSIKLIDSRRIHSFNYQLLKQNLSSSFYKDTLYGGSNTDRAKDSDTVIHEYSERFWSNYVVTNVQFFNNLKPGTTITFTDNNELKYFGEIPSYLVEGVTYEHVRVFENMIMEDERLPRKIYYARNVGVIRKELFNGQVWNLKRYFINK